ncbi:STAS domain-containing protein [Phytohabitans houttuyneae]|uniref:STAS domain-containing protein n=1 Tax=Phytohabitans houttuyneae TaxID=1076126 RepID=UPI001563D5AB|nr:STAS domain-containing protein [Phytohabitans houttuyneae]
MRVLLSGEVDMAVKEQLHDVLHVVADSARVTEVDLRHVTFMDCAAIGELVRAHVDARHRGKTVVVTQPQGFVREVLDFANVLTMLTSDHPNGRQRPRPGR